MKISKMRTCYIETPMGYQMDKPIFSWVAEASLGEKVMASSVQIAMDADFSQVVFDSKKKEDIPQHAYEVDISLMGKTRYFWRVRAWSDMGEEAVGESWFETGKKGEKWCGKWITPPFSKDIHPYIHKNFSISKTILAARAYAVGLGLYEMEVNGKKVTDEVLAPFCTDYNNWIQYQTYDLTDFLKKGENAIGVLLGNGWYKGRFGFRGDEKELYGDHFLFLGEIEILYEDGSKECIASDDSWRCVPSFMEESSIYDGEKVDARKDLPGRGTIDCPMEDAPFACIYEKEMPPVTERLSPPLRVVETKKPVQLIRTPKGEDVLDFGQVLTGWMTFTSNVPEGQKVSFQFGELLQEGNFYNENLRTAKQEYAYISDGVKKEVRPYFTFYGFRYVKIVGLSEIRPEDFTACVIYSDIPQTGYLETGNPKVNQLISNAMWGQKGNFLDIPTDCPQRDERMGWTGDAQVFSGTACYNMYTPAFFGKFLHDMLLEQRALKGSVPFVVPDVQTILAKREKEEESAARNPTEPKPDAEKHGACAWADAAVIIPWTLYRHYGDKNALARHYENMKLWVDYVRSVDEEKCGGKRLWCVGFHFADWLALDSDDPKNRFGGTDPFFIASSYYFYSTSILAKAAAVLGKKEDADFYEKWAKEVRAAIQKEYFEKDGRLKIRTQTAHILSLYFQIAEEHQRAGLVEGLKTLLDENQGHLTTGFVGTAYLCLTLSSVGLSDYAYRLLLNEDYPGWLYSVNMGATTIWERWNSVLPNGLVSDTGMNSMNHYAYGAILEWIYRCALGIEAKEGSPSFSEVLIRPNPDKRLGFIKGSYDSSYGTYKSAWKYEDEKLIYEITVPFGGSATFSAIVRGNYLCNGEEVQHEKGEIKRKLRPGSYTITTFL